jgi:hypothetical protein
VGDVTAELARLKLHAKMSTPTLLRTVSAR